jgi:hypothetical protein
LAHSGPPAGTNWGAGFSFVFISLLFVFSFIKWAGKFSFVFISLLFIFIFNCASIRAYGLAFQNSAANIRFFAA